jgi:hypothetical protein
MYKVEDLNRQVAVPQVQYLQSVGVSSDKEGGGKVSTFFFPSMVFPNHTELISVTIMCNNIKGTTDKVIHFSTALNGSATPSDLKDYALTHKVGEMCTTLNFKVSLLLEPHQPFFFHHQEGELTDSCLVLGFRNFNGNFGKAGLKTPE